jgi:hypothetical protein
MEKVQNLKKNSNTVRQLPELMNCCLKATAMTIWMVMMISVSFVMGIFYQNTVLNMTGFSVSAVANGCMKTVLLTVCIVPSV